MPTAMTFARVKQYLEAIADNPNAALSVDNSPHRRFWNVTYAQFVNGNVPVVQCHQQPIPLIDHANPAQSAFFVILGSTFCSKPKMPDGGPFITDVGYQVTLADGVTTVPGQKIKDDILEWLSNGFPENGNIPAADGIGVISNPSEGC